MLLKASLMKQVADHHQQQSLFEKIKQNYIRSKHFLLLPSKGM